MRHSPAAIRAFLAEQPRSGLPIAAFCAANQLKVSTFYSWKRRYGPSPEPAASGFCQLQPRVTDPARGLRLPSGLRLELTGLSTREIAALILEIDRCHA